jgi:hypothetical protein
MPLSRRFAIGLAALLLAAGGWLFWNWLRDSSLVRVNEVRVTGLTTRDAPDIRHTLREAALRMTTLDYSEEELRHAVEAFPAVESVSADADFPHKLVISVREHRPVAALVSGDGRRVAVASDGTLLPRERDVRLPAVKVDAISDEGRLGDGIEATLVRVAGLAPEELRPLIDRVYRAGDGIRVAIDGGPTLRFGAPLRLAAKWVAGARVLAEDSGAAAASIDLRIPERPSAAYGDGGQSEATQVPAPTQEQVQQAAQTAAAATPQAGATGTAGAVATP